MSEFSNGIWEYVEYIPEGITLNGKEYLIMSGGEDVALALRENDARLIAAAPELYHMVAYLLGYVREWKAISSGTVYKEKVSRDISKAETLLARIDGEEASDAQEQR